MKKILFATTAVLLLPLASCGGDDGGSAESFCTEATALKGYFDTLDSEDVFGDPDAMKETFTKAEAAIKGLADGAPAEVADELDLMVDAYADLGDALKGVDYDFQALFTDEDAAPILERMDSDEVNKAGDTLDAYAQKECGFTIGDEATEDTSAPEDTTGDSGDSSDTLPGSDISIPLDGTTTEQAAAVYMQIFGLDEAKATCLAEKTVGLSPEETADMTSVMGFFADCDIDLSEITGNLSS